MDIPSAQETVALERRSAWSRRDLLIALSFSNLCFFDIWDRAGSHWHVNFTREPPGLAHVLGPPLFVVLTTACVVWAVLASLRAYGSARIITAAKWVSLILLCLLPLNIFRVTVLKLTAANASGILAGTAMLVLLALGFAVFRGSGWLLNVPASLTVAVAPLLAVQFSYALWSSYDLTAGSAFADKPSAPLIEGATPKSRIVWMVFDEMDGCLSVANRPRSVQLPELDRLMRQSVFGDQVYPAGPATEVAMPSMITGRHVRAVKWTRPDKAVMHFQNDSGPVNWNEESSIFSKLRAAGLNTALVGWYLPYCRVIGGTLASCSWQPSTLMKRNATRPFIDQVKAAFVSRIHAMPLMGRIIKAPPPPDVVTDAQEKATIRAGEAADYLEIRKNAFAALADNRLDVVFVHWSIPHLMGIYDRRRAELAGSDQSSYLDNLALVDVTIGEVRRVLESAGRWDETTMLITADHPFRLNVNRALFSLTAEDVAAMNNKQCPFVPFILKMPGQQEGLVINKPFNNVVIHDLLLELAQGRIRSGESVVEWLTTKTCTQCNAAVTSARPQP